MAVWRNHIEPGADVSWRHMNGRTREWGHVIAVGTDTLTVDITDNAGTYRFTGTPEDFPGLYVERRPGLNGGA